MKTRPLKNYDSSVGCEVYDIDLNSDDELLELGKLIGQQCIVYIDQKIEPKRLRDIMTGWGQNSRALLHNYVIQEKIKGRHWREVFLHLGFVAKDVLDISDAVSIVTYKKDEKGRPKGIFSNGELDWHSDQVGLDDSPRMIGLTSLSDSANSQTQFLCTHDAYMKMSSDMRSMLDELYVKHKWRDGVMAPGLNKTQSLLIHYNMVPLDGMETKLVSESVGGTRGIKMPAHSFDGFVGMSLEESKKLLKELQKSVYQDQYVYTQNWKDGEIVFMDQEVTLHKRPTNIQDGNLRTMARVCTYMNYVFPNKPLATQARWDGKMYDYDDFVAMVDEDRKQKFYEEQGNTYTSMDDNVPVIGVDTGKEETDLVY